jgi:hypothetical protein
LRVFACGCFVFIFHLSSNNEALFILLFAFILFYFYFIPFFHLYAYSMLTFFLFSTQHSTNALCPPVPRPSNVRRHLRVHGYDSGFPANSNASTSSSHGSFDNSVQVLPPPQERHADIDSLSSVNAGLRYPSRRSLHLSTPPPTC